MKMNLTSNFKIKAFHEGSFLVECQTCGQMMFDDGSEKKMFQHAEKHRGQSFDDILDALEQEEKA